MKEAVGPLVLQLMPGEQIIETVNLDTVWVEAPVFERDLPLLAGEVAPVFTTPAYPETEFSGSIVGPPR